MASSIDRRWLKVAAVAAFALALHGCLMWLARVPCARTLIGDERSRSPGSRWAWGRRLRLGRHRPWARDGMVFFLIADDGAVVAKTTLRFTRLGC